MSVSATPDFQSAAMLSRDQLLHLFNRFSFVTSQPDVKRRISDAVQDNQEAVAVTTAIQEEIFLEMGVDHKIWSTSCLSETTPLPVVIQDPRFGIACLGKVNMVYENDRDLMIHFYRFVAREEMVCEEAELGPEEFAERMQFQHELHEQQLEMLKHMRKFHQDNQTAIFEKLRQQMVSANFESGASIMSSEQIQEIVCGQL